MALKRRPPRRGGRPRGRAEEKYIGIRTLMSPTNFDQFLNDERYDQTLKMALEERIWVKQCRDTSNNETFRLYGDI